MRPDAGRHRRTPAARPAHQRRVSPACPARRDARPGPPGARCAGPPRRATERATARDACPGTTPASPSAASPPAIPGAATRRPRREGAMRDAQVSRRVAERARLDPGERVVAELQVGRGQQQDQQPRPEVSRDRRAPAAPVTARGSRPRRGGAHRERRLGPRAGRPRNPFLRVAASPARDPRPGGARDEDRGRPAGAADHASTPCRSQCRPCSSRPARGCPGTPLRACRASARPRAPPGRSGRSRTACPRASSRRA